MPLTEYWRIYLADWVHEAEDMLAPYEVDRFILAVAAELDRLAKIETAARDCVNAITLVGEADDEFAALAALLEPSDAR